LEAVVLAGGLGTCTAEENYLKRKKVHYIEVGGKPTLRHIMKHYSIHGVNEFIVCCGYKGHVIKEYYAKHSLHKSNVTFDIASNIMHVCERHAEPWKVSLIETGGATMTSGRLRRVWGEGTRVKHKPLLQNAQEAGSPL
jgi:glucose-1-phosphate cytidylyltransferase